MKFNQHQIKKLRQAYFFISEFKKILENLNNKQLFVGMDVVQEYDDFVKNFRKTVPSILEEFDQSNYYDVFSPNDFFLRGRELSYKTTGLLVRVIKDLSKIKGALDYSEETSPLVIAKNFSFVKNTNLRTIIERDYVWVNKCLAVEAWKPVIILAGGLIEALLLDRLLATESRAKSSSKAPKENGIKKWSLENLIDVAVDLSIINVGAEKLSDAVRHYRNLVHPGNELRAGLRVEPEEAKIAAEILNIIIRDLQSNK